ncbi:metal ABC transporter ATP-binding protein [Ruegeria sediminis]|uniref:Metal ABC transporter ATP-binding protein n=1 Tax=Ruegeria sediminis TaxID=2583820 RepID=A0ABY2X2Z0_9RHOB|nr:metal ABC transporter ATP-binding protein [Ruegeria sediminis]TMV09742.1 metal ABC transporter ATP-binding protein [Ruegeria sediminis]
MTVPLISAKDLSVQLDGRPILQHISVEIAAGEIVTIVGPNGSGKSTFLRALIGAVPLSKGRVTRAPGLKIGYVPQKLALDASLPMTVQRFLGLPRRVSTAAALQALGNAGVPDLCNRQMTDLSGGQFQRVLLARALLDRPQLLMLDEATQGLDQPGAAAFYQRIEQVRQELGCAIVMVSHDLHVVMAASDRVLCLNGHICCQGSPQMVADAPEYRALFGTGTKGTMALYRHQHSHSHDHGPDHQDHHHEHERAQ